MTFEEQVEKIIIYDSEGEVSENKAVEASNFDEVNDVLNERADERTKQRTQKIKEKAEEQKRLRAEKEEENKSGTARERFDEDIEEELIEIVELESEIVDEGREEEELVFLIVEEMPEFPGGADAMGKYITNNIIYPKEAVKKGISGVVYVQFVVEKDGLVDQVKIARGVHELLDNEAIRVVKSMPKWKPGMQKGEPVSVSFIIPVNFNI
jgi:TonB family protein